MNDQRDIKDLLRDSILKEERKTRRRLDTSKTLNSDTAAQDKKPKSASKPKDTSGVPKSDDTILEELKARYQRIGFDTNKQGVIRAGLQMLSTMSGAELRLVMRKVEERTATKQNDDASD